MEAKILKYGQFEATNGVDVILATYARGTKQADGKMHPTWTLEMGKKSFIIEGNKDEALQKAKELLELPMSRPLTEKEATAMLEEDGSIHGIVAVPVSSILNHHTDEFLNDLGAKLCDVPVGAITYLVVAISEKDNNVLHIRVNAKQMGV